MIYINVDLWERSVKILHVLLLKKMFTKECQTYVSLFEITLHTGVVIHKILCEDKCTLS